MVEPHPGLAGAPDGAEYRADERELQRQLEPVRYFAAAFAKAVRSFNMYARNNAALLKFLDDAFRFSQQAFEAVGDLEFDVRRDKLTVQGLAVLEDADREYGIPFRLFREGVRRFAIDAGIEQPEMNRLIELLAKQRGSGELDDDLVSVLWREALPHVRYVTLDVFAVTSAADASAEEDQAQEELRQDLDKLLSAIYQGGMLSADGVKSVNISTDDLVALASLGDERERDTERIGTATKRGIFNLKPEQVEALQQEAGSDQDEALLDTTYDVLLGVLFRVRSARDSAQVIGEILNLFDMLMLERDFKAAAGLVRRLDDFKRSGDLKNMALVKQLLKLFASEQRLSQIAVAINDGVVTSVTQLSELLGALGTDVVPALINLLPVVQQPQHRRLLCDIMIDVKPPSIELLRKCWGQSEWFVDRDLLYLASRSADPEATDLIFTGCDHGHARVRQQALGMLQSLPGDRADDALLRALTDVESAVRVTAVRTLVARRTPSAAKRLSGLVQDPAFEVREPAEQKTFLLAYAALAGPDAVGVLDHLLNGGQQQGGGLLDRLRGALEDAVDADPKLELRVAAAVALGSVGTPSALDALRRGEKSKSKSVRETCARVLALPHGSAERLGGGRGGEIP
jgi:HEAT repeat protein